MYRRLLSVAIGSLLGVVIALIAWVGPTSANSSSSSPDCRGGGADAHAATSIHRCPEPCPGTPDSRAHSGGPADRCPAPCDGRSVGQRTANNEDGHCPSPCSTGGGRYRPQTTGGNTENCPQPCPGSSEGSRSANDTGPMSTTVSSSCPCTDEGGVVPRSANGSDWHCLCDQGYRGTLAMSQAGTMSSDSIGCPPVGLPEAPSALLLPVVGVGVVAGAGYVVARRRRRTARRP